MKTPFSAARLFTACLFALPMAAQAAAPAAGTNITNTASATYTDAGATTRNVNSNTVVTVVVQVAALSMTANGAKSVSAGSTATYAHTLTNTGNGPDTFVLSSANGGGFSATNVQFFVDANGDGVADNATPISLTGVLAAGATFKFVAVVSTPGAAAGGTSNAAVITATSLVNASVIGSNTDTTTIGVGSGMDLTNNAPGAGAPGAGPGVETLPVVTNVASANTTTRYTLYLNNAGNASDTFNLAASTDSTFGNVTLPAGSVVVFKDAGGNTITSATVAAGGNTQVFADLIIPSNAILGAADIYFRALSPTTGVNDRIHNAIIVLPLGGQVALVKTQSIDANCDGVADLLYLQTNIVAGAVPGACIRYHITATNAGLTSVTGLSITDAIPANTTYHGTVAAASTVGSVAAPSNGAIGTVTATVGILTAGQSAVLSFGVKIDQ